MKTILVLTDFSKSANNAAQYAAKLADKMKAKIILFNAYADYVPVSPLESIGISSEELAKNSNQSLKKIMINVRKKHPDVPISTSSMGTSSSEDIINFAGQINADLMVMGTKGANALSRIFIGSTTATMIANSTIPVLAIPANARFRDVEKIIYASDMIKLKKHAAGWISYFAELMNAEVIILSILLAAELYPEEIKKTKRQIGSILRKTRHRFYLEEDFTFNLSDKVQRFLRKEKAGMLVLVHRQQDFVYRLFNPSLSKKISYDIKVPLLSIPEKTH